MKQVFAVKSPSEMFALAATVAKNLQGGETIELVGDLGSGKTTFTRGLVQALDSDDEVSSPSFTISNVYRITRPYDSSPDFLYSSGAQGASEQRTESYMKYGEGAAELATQRYAESDGRVLSSAQKQASTVQEIWHFDFYRLAEGGVVGQELAEVINDPKVVVVVEWAQTVKSLLPASRLRLEFKTLSESGREVEFDCPLDREYLLRGLA